MTETTEASRPRASFGPEVLAWLLFAVCLGAMEGGVVSIMVRTFYSQAVGALTLDYTVAALVGAPLFANLASLGWASLGQSRGLSRLLVPLQLLCVLCLLLVAAAPRNAAGLAMVVTGAVSSRLLWSGALGFSAMARQPLPIVEGRIEQEPPAISTPLRPLEGALG